MSRLTAFFSSNKTKLLFGFYLVLSLTLTLSYQTFNQVRLLHTSGGIGARIHETTSDWRDYFSLSAQNEVLRQENARLKAAEWNQPTTHKAYSGPYQAKATRVVRNTFNQRDNYLLINTGTKDSITTDMGVVSNLGLIGIVEQTQKGYSSVMSILNSRSRISAQVNRTGHFGSLVWNGSNHRRVQLIDIPITAELKKGDTIATAGMSGIFPEGILIGRLMEWKKSADQNYLELEVALFQDMSRVRNVYVLKNKDKISRDSLIR
jgi:rod shape-determining protein MreC